MADTPETPPTTPPPSQSRTNWLAVAALIIGFFALLGFLIPPLGLPASIIGLILGLTSPAKPDAGIRSTALALCAIGFAFSAVGMIALLRL
ncbi:MAG: hypothetical protein ACREJO_05550 [Phycisphaerales bacterium]